MIELPDLKSLGEIGRPLRRKEDERLLTGRGHFSDDFTLPGQTYTAVVRSPYPHARILRIDTAAGVGVARGDRHPYGKRLRCGRSFADPAQPGAADPLRHEIDRSWRRPDLYRPADAAALGQGAPCRRGGRDRGRGDRGASAGRRRSGRSRLSGIALDRADQRRSRPGRASCLGRNAGQRAGRHFFWRRGSDRAGLCRRRPHRRDGIQCRPRDRGADGAARRSRLLGRRHRPRHFMGRQRRGGAAKGRARGGARRRAG